MAKKIIKKDKQKSKPIVKVNNNKDYAIELKDITKTFLGGKIVANKNVNIAIKKNEIHAICGENGAGKSTLMSIIYGIYQQDSGQVFINGKEVHFKNAAQASNAGLGMVHQHFKLVKAFTILENIILGIEPTNKFGVINKKIAASKIEEICKKYKLDLDLNLKTSLASVGMQQRTEIIKLLYRGAEILIFDEPTAVLSDDEIDGFLQMVKYLRQQGKTIVIISHKLNEIRQIADTVTILRKGQTVGTYPINKITNEQISTLMVGTKIVAAINQDNYVESESVSFSIEHLTILDKINRKIKKVDDLSISAKPGEIIGIAGIEGNGQTELALAIVGLLKVNSGKILMKVSGTMIDITNYDIATRNKLGMSVVHEDRHKYGCILDETVAFNLISNQLDEKFSNFLIVNKKAINRTVESLCARFNIFGANKGKSLMRSLSGGNQQKVVIAREMSKHHSVIVMVQPTRGLDVGAINDIHKAIFEEAASGKAIILISYELDEILAVADTILVMDNGKIVYSSPRNKTDRKTIGKFLSQTVSQKVKTLQGGQNE